MRAVCAPKYRKTFTRLHGSTCKKAMFCQFTAVSEVLFREQRLWTLMPGKQKVRNSFVRPTKPRLNSLNEQGKISVKKWRVTSFTSIHPSYVPAGSANKRGSFHLPGNVANPPHLAKCITLLTQTDLVHIAIDITSVLRNEINTSVKLHRR
jgi:hypothetical protein